MNTFYPFILVISHLIPLSIAWILFTFIYSFLPNTTVSGRAALIAGIIAGTSYYFLQWGYIHFQIGVSRYSAVYGSFAAIPLFLVWLNMSWLVFLVGAEMTCQIQENEEWVLISNPNDKALIKTSRQLIALLVVHECIQNFKKGESPLSLLQIAKEIGVSSKEIDAILIDLIHSNILSEVSGNLEGKTYLPARNIDTIHIKDVCDALDKNTEESQMMNVKLSDSPLVERLHAYHQKMALESSNAVIASIRS